MPMAAGPPELDIVVWKLKGDSADASSEFAQKLFDACAKRNLHLALVQLPCSWFETGGRDDASGNGTVTSLRSVLMKPEHEEWLDKIWEIWTLARREIVGE